MESSTSDQIAKAVVILPNSLKYLDVTGMEPDEVLEIIKPLREEIERAEWFEIYLRLVSHTQPASYAVSLTNSYYEEFQKRFEK